MTDPRDQMKATLERALLVLAVTVGIGTFVGALALIALMDAGSRSQGGRFYVAIGATLALGWVDTQVARMLARSTPWILTPSEPSRRFRVVSLTLLGVGVAVLFGAATWLP